MSTHMVVSQPHASWTGNNPSLGLFLWMSDGKYHHLCTLHNFHTLLSSLLLSSFPTASAKSSDPASQLINDQRPIFGYPTGLGKPGHLRKRSSGLSKHVGDGILVLGDIQLSNGRCSQLMGPLGNNSHGPREFLISFGGYRSYRLVIGVNK